MQKYVLMDIKHQGTYILFIRIPAPDMFAHHPCQDILDLYFCPDILGYYPCPDIRGHYPCPAIILGHANSIVIGHSPLPPSVQKSVAAFLNA